MEWVPGRVRQKDAVGKGAWGRVCEQNLSDWVEVRAGSR